MAPKVEWYPLSDSYRVARRGKNWGQWIRCCFVRNSKDGPGKGTMHVAVSIGHVEGVSVILPSIHAIARHKWDMAERGDDVDELNGAAEEGTSSCIPGSVDWLES